MNQKNHAPAPPVELPVPEENGDEVTLWTAEEMREARRHWSADAFEEGVIEGRRREVEERGSNREGGWLLLITGILVGIAIAGLYVWVAMMVTGA